MEGRSQPRSEWLEPLGNALLELGSCTHVWRESRGDAQGSPYTRTRSE